MAVVVVLCVGSNAVLVVRAERRRESADHCVAITARAICHGIESVKCSSWERGGRGDSPLHQ